MKYIGIPLGMWVLFEKSFRKNLVSEFGYNKITAKQISKNAKSRYKSIIRNLPEFEKGDQFKTNIVGVKSNSPSSFISTQIPHFVNRPS